MQDTKRSKRLHLTQLGMLSAIIILMSFTPLGYLKVGFLEITFLPIPVVVGAIMLGPLDGAILGAIFGLTSFAQCFGLSAFGSTLLSINPVYTFILCLVPRILIGLFSGYVLKGLKKIHANQFVAYSLASLAGALTNTVFFVGFLLLFFLQTDFIQSFGNSTIEILGVLITVNVIIEAVVCAVIGTLLAKALGIVFIKMNKPSSI
ncbi:MAG: hypothetical protein A2Y15_09075 [Clostridiales bacterium GWF2_36_10]|nr:MAG: hypothetical protein A2Y15_09075 [Clostridiales bacterium GWF2_36_10]HAN21469.1 ECF transporter S component [Clostridiales bacterium]